jgi:hypothetical protein
MQNFTAIQATIYRLGSMGWTSEEVAKLDVSTKVHAQYNHAVRMQYTPRGKRKPVAVVWSSGKSIVIEGWGHPVPAKLEGMIQIFDDKTNDAGFSVVIDGWIAAKVVKVLADFRQYSYHTGAETIGATE